MKRLIFVVATAVLLTGCSNAVEISERDFVVMAGIDKADNGNYRVTSGSAVLTGEGGGKGSVSIKSAEGESLPHALELNDKSDALSPYYGQLKTVLLGEELLKDERMLGDTIEVLLKNNDINMKTILLGCEGEAKAVIEATGKKENEYGLYIWDYYKNLGDAGADTFKMTVNDIATERGGGYILPKVKTKGEEIKTGGAYVLDGYALKGDIEDGKMLGAMLLREDIKGAVISFGKESAKVKSNKRKISFFKKDKTVLCGIDIFIKVQPLTADFDTARAEESIKTDTEEVLEAVYTDYGTDGLGLYSLMEKREPEIKADGMEFAVSVSVTVE